MHYVNYKHAESEAEGSFMRKIKKKKKENFQRN